MNEIVDHVMRLKQTYHVTRLYCDGANPEVIRELKRRIGEYQDYHDFTDEIWAFRNGSWQIIPVNFQKRHRGMLQWTHTLMSKMLVKIHPSLQNLLVSLRTAVVIREPVLKRTQVSSLIWP